MLYTHVNILCTYVWLDDMSQLCYTVQVFIIRGAIFFVSGDTFEKYPLHETNVY